MTGRIFVGLLLLIAGVGLTYGLHRVRFIRQNAVLRIGTVFNPGLVGVCAGLAFMTGAGFFVYLALGLVMATLPVIVFMFPKVIMADAAQQAKPPELDGSENGDPPSQDSN